MEIVTAGIIIRNGKVLIARRAANQSLPGYWEFPGGKIELNETPEECLERELFEELSIKVKAHNQIISSDYKYAHGEFRILGILADIVEGSPLPSVHDAVEWSDINDLHKYQLAPADIPISDKIKELYNVV